MINFVQTLCSKLWITFRKSEYRFYIKLSEPIWWKIKINFHEYRSYIIHHHFIMCDFTKIIKWGWYIGENNSIYAKYFKIKLWAMINNVSLKNRSIYKLCFTYLLYKLKKKHKNFSQVNLYKTISIYLADSILKGWGKKNFFYLKFIYGYLFLISLLWEFINMLFLNWHDITFFNTLSQSA